MPYLLVVLLAFALLVTLVGFVLSFGQQSRRQGDISAMTRNGRRYGERQGGSVQRYQRYRQAPATSTRISRSVSIPAWDAGRVFGGRFFPGAPGKAQWSVIVMGLVSVFIISLFLLNIVFPHNAILNPIWFADSAQPTAVTQQQQQQQQLYGASKAVARLGQLDPAQYSSSQEYNTWAYSACSAAAMTEVFNAYGHHYRITNVLEVEAAIHEITPQQGLLEDIGIQRTAARFGFQTSWGYKLSLAQIIAVANNGEPVIVSFPPYKYAGGHLLVVIGGNSTTVFLADSSLYNRTALSYAQFMQWWGGFSAVVTPS